MFNDSIETARLLIDAKSPLNIRDKEELGDPALPHAVGNHNAARMRLMLGFPCREDEAPRSSRRTFRPRTSWVESCPLDCFW